MKQQLIEILELSSNATEEQIIAAASELNATVSTWRGSDARERAVRAKITESCGAMTYEVASEAIDHQAAHKY